MYLKMIRNILNYKVYAKGSTVCVCVADTLQYFLCNYIISLKISEMQPLSGRYQ